MPMPPEIGMMLGHDHDVSVPHFDEPIAARAEISLAGGVRLDRDDDLVVEGAQPEQAAHATRATATVRVTTTSTTSVVDRRRTRNGLKPITPSYEQSGGAGAGTAGLSG